jgi:hypothetical protein
MADPALVLRDIHQPPAPGWWPPAPGWWAVGTALVLLAAVLALLAWRRRRRRQAIACLFDDRLAAADTPAAQVAAMSELLRRAARRRDPGADRLDGEAWLAFLDAGARVPRFDGPAGRLLLDGAYRPGTAAADVDALRPLARARYLEWMGAR